MINLCGPIFASTKTTESDAQQFLASEGHSEEPKILESAKLAEALTDAFGEGGLSGDCGCSGARPS
jgi:hypothetical protein